ncbi:hypothetical protein RE476_12700 [Methanolobus mangrovi]|uniref:Uncharacterized protein n=1 Tax=Methanolobus mangrovi TaxID=3072977 RepID=A0AA51UFB8_9EURY|nr:hypothetical protein [Methanolobus mangrovi]WMW22212.1 hypothetical protein RE476_12700 [Methanolobus mangrovi]
MIFPDEYKHIGHSREIPDGKDRRIYFLTKYLIVENCDSESSYSLYEVTHQGGELLREVTALNMLASGDEIVRYGKELNIKDRALLIEIASDICKGNITTVIFTGIDKHLTFVHKPDLSAIMDIEIVDVVPPEPSWLASVVRRLEQSGIFGELTIKFSENLTNLRKFEGENTVFPCSSSGLEGKCLDCDVIEEDGALLVGCEISRTLFESRFPGLEYSFINICPFKSDVFKPSKPFITRCCRSEKSGIVTINGIRGAMVHWGASEFEVAKAVWELIADIRKNKEEQS